jgi:hypothetical protein
MSRKKIVLQFILGALLLFAMLFQSFHGTEHLAEKFTAELCHHENGKGQQLTHSHPQHDSCFSCEFTFGQFTAQPAHFTQSLCVIAFGKKDALHVSFFGPSFTGSLYSLRGPPTMS